MTTQRPPTAILVPRTDAHQEAPEGLLDLRSGRVVEPARVWFDYFLIAVSVR
ncbi:MAG: hypothetical protein ACRDTX_28230 [Pseudonocardiaceae bacterium]